MSSLLAGPSSVSPWIEDSVFGTLRQGPIAQKPRLAQVMAISNSVCCPSVMILHDGRTSVFAVLKKTPKQVSKGCIVRISDWSISLVEHCAGEHVPHLLSKRDSVSDFLELRPRLCFSVGRVETLGAHGMGLVGNPTAVDRAVQVRRALLSLEHRKVSLQQQLKLPLRLLNVEELFAQNKRDEIAQLFNKADQCQQQAAQQQTEPAVVLGNVEELLAESKDVPLHQNRFQRIIALADKIDKEQTERGVEPRVATIAEILQTTGEPSTGAAVDGSKADSRDRIHSTLKDDSRDNGSKDNEKDADSRDESDHADSDIGGISDMLISQTQNDADDELNNKFVEPQGKNDDEEDAVESPSSVEPYGIDADVRKTSLVSLTGIQTVFKSAINRRSFASETEQRDDERVDSEPSPATSVEMEPSKRRRSVSFSLGPDDEASPPPEDDSEAKKQSSPSIVSKKRPRDQAHGKESSFEQGVKSPQKLSHRKKKRRRRAGGVHSMFNWIQREKNNRSGL